MGEVWTTCDSHPQPRYYAAMTTTKPKAWDGRREKYRSIRISKAAFEELEKRAKKEKRTIIAQMDVILKV